MAHYTYIGQDAAPAECFKELAGFMEDPKRDGAKHKVTCLLGTREGFPYSDQEIAEAVTKADIVLLGMSSSRELARPEIIAGRIAVDANVRFGFYGDILRCWARALPGCWFDELADKASFYLGVHEADAEASKEALRFARRFGPGNPQREALAFPALTRMEAREALSLDGETAVFLACGKVPSINHWSCLEALDKLNGMPGITAVITPHPNDRTPLSEYEEVIEFSPVPAMIVTREKIIRPHGYVTNSGFRTTAILRAADLFIGHSTALGFYLRVPVIEFVTAVALERYKRIVGNLDFELVQDGAAVLATSNTLKPTILELLTPAGFEPMRRAQMEKYPIPKKRGEALRKIAAALESML